MIYAGIDIGLNGGIALLEDTGELLEVYPMPTFKAWHGGREVEVDNIHAILSEADKVFVEMAAKFTKGKMALCSMWNTRGLILGLLRLGKVDHMEFASTTWQKEWGINHPSEWDEKMTTKDRALKVAHDLWPSETFLKTEKCRRPHDGMVDAALIAEFGRRYYG